MFSTLVQRWTSLLPSESRLGHIEIYSCYGDESERLHQEWNGEEGNEGAGLWRTITEYAVKYSTALKDQKWVLARPYEHRDARHHYFCDSWGFSIGNTWMHVEDESVEAQEEAVSSDYLGL